MIIVETPVKTLEAEIEKVLARHASTDGNMDLFFSGAAMALTWVLKGQEPVSEFKLVQ